MDKEITVPRFCNYTDLRQKKEISAIEAETIKNYAKSLSADEMRLFLKEVSDEDLITENHIRLINRKSRLENIERYMSL